MMEAARAGGDRQALHERLRGAAMDAWSALARGEENPLERQLAADASLTALVDRPRFGACSIRMRTSAPRRRERARSLHAWRSSRRFRNSTRLRCRMTRLNNDALASGV